MRWYYWILISLLFLVLMAYIYVLVIKSNLKIWIRISRLNLSTIKISDLLSAQGEVTTKADFGLKIENNNSFKISIKDINLELYYTSNSGKHLIANTENVKNISLNPRQTDEFIGTLVFHIGKPVSDILLKYSTKQNIEFDYKLKFKMFGFSLSYKGKYKLDHTQTTSTGYKIGEYIKIV